MKKPIVTVMALAALAAGAAELKVSVPPGEGWWGGALIF